MVVQLSPNGDRRRGRRLKTSGQTRAPSHAGHAARTRHYHRRRRRRRPRFPSVRPWKKCQERRIELSELGEKKKCVGSAVREGVAARCDRCERDKRYIVILNWLVYDRSMDREDTSEELHVVSQSYIELLFGC